MKAWLRRWLGVEPLSTVYVVCLKGVPVGAYGDEMGVHAAIADTPKRDVRVYTVPLVESTRT